MDMQGQLDKLEFLMQSMIKTSRLETGIISLSKKRIRFMKQLRLHLVEFYLMLKKRTLKLQLIVIQTYIYVMTKMDF